MILSKKDIKRYYDISYPTALKEYDNLCFIFNVTHLRTNHLAQFETIEESALRQQINDLRPNSKKR